jgi:hypothetical protein
VRELQVSRPSESAFRGVFITREILIYTEQLPLSLDNLQEPSSIYAIMLPIIQEVQ